MEEIARELFAIVLANTNEYKHRVQVIQFLVDLIWELKFPEKIENEMEVDQGAHTDTEMRAENSESEINQIFDALASLFGVSTLIFQTESCV